MSTVQAGAAPLAAGGDASATSLRRRLALLLRRDKVGALSALIMLAIIFVAIFASVVSPSNPTAVVGAPRLAPLGGVLAGGNEDEGERGGEEGNEASGHRLSPERRRARTASARPSSARSPESSR